MANNSSNELSKNIKQWIAYDDYLKQMNQKTKSIREKKDLIEEKITTTLKNNSLTNTKLKTGNNYIIYQESNSNCSLSYKFIQDALGKYLSEKQTTQICDILKKERESHKKTSFSLKRVSNE